MAVTFTKEQQQVIGLRNRNILVSAAAGSGKTAVLVERIITRLTKDTPPLDVDQLLIVTFTDAAASEMKERIHKAIEDALEKEPGNAHLQRQATLIHQAQITTIHKFCLSVIRAYFATIDLDPGFRVVEEGELKLLEKDVVLDVLEEAYLEADSRFLDFVESFATGKDDRTLEELVLQLYKLSRSYPNPKQWLETCVRQYDVNSKEELEAKDFIKDILEEIHLCLNDIKELLEYGIDVCEEPDGPIAYRATLHTDLVQVEKLLRVKTFEDMQRLITNITWESLARNKGASVSEQKIQQVKVIRDQVKKLIKSLTQQYFFDDLDVMQEELLCAKEHMNILTDLVCKFSEKFAEEKRRKNVIDFEDMEQFALQILVKEEAGELVPTPVAKNYQKKFAEIMIDEYQDSNLVQEAILTSVSGVSTGNYNIFMVGDVKQSIYRFRLSRPELFMEKYHTYALDDSDKQRIDLHKNFRSRKEVLESTNFVFEQSMIPAFGGISYDEKATLYVGADYEERQGNETELLFVTAPESTSYDRMELEANAIARKIKTLMADHQVKDKETGEYRKLRYSDIVVLTRSLKGYEEVLFRVLKKAGIPIHTNSREGYFASWEIQLILNFLEILDNPRQDIPFTAVLTSMFVNLTSEDLAQVRKNTQGETMYESVCRYITDGKELTLVERLKVFLHTLDTFRERVPYVAIHDLLWQLYEETGYRDYIGAFPQGEQRVANLDMLIEKAVAFEGTSYKGLFHFVRYIEQLQKYDVDYGEANILDENTEVIRLMSIHKSKGLEFPIVFVAGLGRQFNMQDVRKSIVVHPDLGVGIDSIDAVARVKAPTLLKKAIQQKIQRESTAEELRVLYVAMTRAKEKLILVGAVSNPVKELSSMASLKARETVELPYYNLTKANKYLDWILSALYRNQCFAKILEDYGLDVPYENPLFGKEMPFRVEEVTDDMLLEQDEEEQYQLELSGYILRNWNTKETYDSEMKAQIEEQFSYEYPYAQSRNMKQKISVSELKKRIYQEEEGHPVFQEEEVIPLLPKFLQEEEALTGASRGTAYHKFLEILDFTQDYSEEILRRIIEQKKQEGLLDENMASCIREKDILGFLTSDIGKRVQNASRCGQYFAEQPFVLGMKSARVYPEAESDDITLIQGIIDVFFEEDGELVVLDYKTDRVANIEELKERYHAQLEYYAEALERLTGKHVKEKIIYSFMFGKEIEV